MDNSIALTKHTQYEKFQSRQRQKWWPIEELCFFVRYNRYCADLLDTLGNV